MSKLDKIPTAALYELRDASFLGVSFPGWDRDDAAYLIGGAAMLMVSRLAVLARDPNLPNRQLRNLIGLARALASVVPDDGLDGVVFFDLIAKLKIIRGPEVDPDYAGPDDPEGQ